MKKHLVPFRIELCEHTEGGITVFKCFAEDDEHAKEQAENAYLDCRIISSTAQPFVIYSANESATSDGAGFWSNTDGWVEFSDATTFTKEESEELNLPLSSGQDAKWVEWAKANETYGGDFEHLCLAPGDEVFWTDPDQGLSSGNYEVISIYTQSGRVTAKDDVLLLKNPSGSVVEAYACELS